MTTPNPATPDDLLGTTGAKAESRSEPIPSDPERAVAEAGTPVEDRLRAWADRCEAQGEMIADNAPFEALDTITNLRAKLAAAERQVEAVENEAFAKLQAAEARVSALEAGLRPFAGLAETIPAGDHDFSVYISAPGQVSHLSAEEFRRARALLSSLQAPPSAPVAGNAEGGGSAAEEWRPTHRHVKRGTDYMVIAEGRAQFATGPHGRYMDDRAVTIYRGEDGAWWARPTGEFNDGRFEPLPPAPTRSGEAG